MCPLLILAALLPLALSAFTAPHSTRAPYAYDAGGMRPRGEILGTFTILDTVTYLQPGPMGAAIPDTVLLVKRAPYANFPGHFTVLDTVFEVGATTDTTLIVRKH
jgi:hypothetical protein